MFGGFYDIFETLQSDMKTIGTQPLELPMIQEK